MDDKSLTGGVSRNKEFDIKEFITKYSKRIPRLTLNLLTGQYVLSGALATTGLVYYLSQKRPESRAYSLLKNVNIINTLISQCDKSSGLYSLISNKKWLIGSTFLSTYLLLQRYQQSSFVGWDGSVTVASYFDIQIRFALIKKFFYFLFTYKYNILFSKLEKEMRSKSAKVVSDDFCKNKNNVRHPKFLFSTEILKILRLQESLEEELMFVLFPSLIIFPFMLFFYQPEWYKNIFTLFPSQEGIPFLLFLISLEGATLLDPYFRFPLYKIGLLKKIYEMNVTFIYLLKK
jgi:hypothetical protein